LAANQNYIATPLIPTIELRVGVANMISSLCLGTKKSKRETVVSGLRRL
jgi:hypothetical protein